MLQHADDPVDRLERGEDAVAEVRERDVPLSTGARVSVSALRVPTRCRSASRRHRVSS